jgi:hypothetical protein
VGGVFRCGRGGEGDGEWCGVLRGGGSTFIGARGGCRAAIMAGIVGETGGGMKGDLSVVKLRFNESNDYCLMVEGGGGVLHRRRGGLGASGAAVAQAGRRRSAGAVRRKKTTVGP